jgi:serine/threonine protein kinase
MIEENSSQLQERVKRSAKNAIYIKTLSFKGRKITLERPIVFTKDNAYIVFKSKSKGDKPISEGSQKQFYKAYDIFSGEPVAFLKPHNPDNILELEKNSNEILKRETTLTKEFIPAWYFEYQGKGNKVKSAMIEKRYSCDLNDFLNENEQELKKEQVVMISLKVAKQLRTLHERKIIHNDVKTKNIFMDEKGHPILADMGYFRYSHETRFLHMGNIDYFAPEKFRDEEKKISFPADVWAFGIVLFKIYYSGLQRSDSENTISYNQESESALFFENPILAFVEASEPGSEHISEVIEKHLQNLSDHKWADPYLPRLSSEPYDDRFRQIILEALNPDPDKRQNIFWVVQKLEEIQKNIEQENKNKVCESPPRKKIKK